MPALIYGSAFQKSANKLENRELEHLAKLLKLLEENFYHPLLHTKYLTGSLEGFLAFRIGRDYRCIFRIIDNEIILLLEVRHRKDIYRK
ncbi:hypothetical protein A3G55_04115 [Candidatus Giovannonibacteria bacterium RIFCSPLOWO2_12_FULL_44_25]|uniref:Uncharacterized protein n=1 Tax=Candidatus Giovannonibacteria bacterium RIFCSPHIGHO2_02_FULL_45_40 TaxID=1798337 RepID=A0A1F5W702_9BACT|nr:MAG: hypothetical protein A2120_01400 [Candidatus Giovannonibacteria bacterium GWA2_45_15]OGF59401.1 MAG: hypothetical protein A2W40_02500 [Candidatus Giovannonibacteria bacterium RIFCSPHIGHO2_01_45_12]OGF60090.1 MAG: hypothetical protein A2656_03780 [Candidatus Giovannonibacteria bacterium RIFCSPHIGHO2_01_FULL_44_100]OGF71448.1 MAG: hypothetical protein A3C05_01595 [Candidatus Giovannonibacteria bacterium RIFCSPHIGHO2_02_FULL_45_40]OGF83675.1 MAG: hypothetical protein A3E63_01260 [Candidatu